MQTALLHLLPAPGPATSAHAGAPVSSVVPAGAPPDFGAALSHAASDMSATGAANEDAAASPLRRRAGARAEPVRGQGRDGHPQASAAATREQTLAGGPRPSDAADSLQASDQEAEPAAASEKAFDEHAGVALSPWLAALVGAASAPAATPASGPTSGLDPAKAAAATRQASVDGRRLGLDARSRAARGGGARRCRSAAQRTRPTAGRRDQRDAPRGGTGPRSAIDRGAWRIHPRPRLWGNALQSRTGLRDPRHRRPVLDRPGRGREGARGTGTAGCSRHGGPPPCSNCAGAGPARAGSNRG